jgi:hypothetical protein
VPTNLRVIILYHCTVPRLPPPRHVVFLCTTIDIIILPGPVRFAARSSTRPLRAAAYVVIRTLRGCHNMLADLSASRHSQFTVYTSLRQRLHSTHLYDPVYTFKASFWISSLSLIYSRERASSKIEYYYIIRYV